VILTTLFGEIKGQETTKSINYETEKKKSVERMIIGRLTNKPVEMNYLGRSSPILDRYLRVLPTSFEGCCAFENGNGWKEAVHCKWRRRRRRRRPDKVVMQWRRFCNYG